MGSFFIAVYVGACHFEIFDINYLSTTQSDMKKIVEPFLACTPHLAWVS